MFFFNLVCFDWSKSDLESLYSRTNGINSETVLNAFPDSSCERDKLL